MAPLLPAHAAVAAASCFSSFLSCTIFSFSFTWLVLWLNLRQHVAVAVYPLARLQLVHRSVICTLFCLPSNMRGGELLS